MDSNSVDNQQGSKENKKDKTIQPVKDLLYKEIKDYYIPAYQRGYRWEKRQAKELLKDIWEFSLKEDKGDKEIYCIQPLVVKEIIKEINNINKPVWEVVDGQQRLTTIYIILSYLSGEVKANIGDYSNYVIHYETREKSAEFLGNLASKKENDKWENIDYFHMYNVYEAIKAWFEKMEKDEPNIRSKFADVLLNRVHYIWYDIKKDQEATDVFTRLNIGKIALTDAELIKALFLNESNFKGLEDIKAKQDEIALEWDRIESTMQNDEFWYFIHEKKYTNQTRIDFLFELLYKNNAYGLENDELELINKEKDKYAAFEYMKLVINKAKPTANSKEGRPGTWIIDIWKKVKNYFLVLEDWYADYRLYHYIGYLVEVGKDDKENPVASLLKVWSKKQSKEDFIGDCSKAESIKGKIFNTLYEENFNCYYMYDVKNNADSSVPGIRDKGKCRNILLLHNVETIIQQNQKMVEKSQYNLPNFSKFPFHLFKKEDWDVEHIRPNAGSVFGNEKHKRDYLIASRKFILDVQTKKSIDEYLINSKGKDFGSLYEDINNKLGAVSDYEKNKINNYTLLDQRTNRQYKNYPYPFKRAFLIEKEEGVQINDKGEKDVAFVPVCTHNIFMKFYTEVPDAMSCWTETDAMAYREEMFERLKDYDNQYFATKLKTVGAKWGSGIIQEVMNCLTDPNVDLKAKFKEIFYNIKGKSLQGDAKAAFDVQEKLTLLWLLQWYMALMTGELTSEKKIDASKKDTKANKEFSIKPLAENLKENTFETRKPSREFCEELCSIGVYAKEVIPELKKGKSLSDYIKEALLYKKLTDEAFETPYVQFMLEMVDSIHDFFEDELKNVKLDDKKDERIKLLTPLLNALLDNQKFIFLSDKFYGEKIYNGVVKQ